MIKKVCCCCFFLIMQFLLINWCCKPLRKCFSPCLQVAKLPWNRHMQGKNMLCKGGGEMKSSSCFLFLVEYSWFHVMLKRLPGRTQTQRDKFSTSQFNKAVLKDSPTSSFFFFLNDLSLTSHTAPPSKLSNLLTVGCVMQQQLGTFNFTATHAVPEWQEAWVKPHSA